MDGLRLGGCWACAWRVFVAFVACVEVVCCGGVLALRA
jgi:hypothetical protein